MPFSKINLTRLRRETSLTRTCWECRKPGHLRGDCPQAKPKPRCPKCNKGSHWVKDCWSQSDDNRAPLNSRQSAPQPYQQGKKHLIIRFFGFCQFFCTRHYNHTPGLATHQRTGRHGFGCHYTHKKWGIPCPSLETQTRLAEQWHGKPTRLKNDHLTCIQEGFEQKYGCKPIYYSQCIL